MTDKPLGMSGVVVGALLVYVVAAVFAVSMARHADEAKASVRASLEEFSGRDDFAECQSVEPGFDVEVAGFEFFDCGQGLNLAAYKGAR